jgi:hypothetical protein
MQIAKPDEKLTDIRNTALYLELCEQRKKYINLLAKLFNEFEAYKAMARSKKCVCDGLDLLVHELSERDNFSRMELYRIRQELMKEKRETELLRVLVKKLQK